jgi:DNA-directed RNA polymerase sigma subunit (sigma70/sigma32)
VEAARAEAAQRIDRLEQQLVEQRRAAEAERQLIGRRAFAQQQATDRLLADLGAARGDAAAGAVERAQLRSELDLLLQLALTSEERDVLRLRYGLDDGNAKSIAAIGRLIGIKVTAVRRLEAGALRSLRKPNFLERLESFLYEDMDA